MASVPVAPTLSSITATGFSIQVNPDGNPAGTYYSFQVIYGIQVKYVTALGTLQDDKVFLNVTSQNVVNAIPNTLYSVALTAADNAAGLNESGIGLPAGATTIAADPMAQSFSNVFSTTVMSHWLANGNPDGTEYEVQLSTDVNFTVNVITSGWIIDIGYAFTNLLPAKTYFSRVKARDLTSVETNWVALGTVQTKVGPAVVQVIRVHNLLSELRFLITWQPNQETNIVNYKIYRSESPTDTANFLLLATVPIPITSYNDKVPYKFGIKNYYKVTAIDDGGNESSLNLTTPSHDETYHSFEEQPFISHPLESDFIKNEDPIGESNDVNQLFVTEFPYRKDSIEVFLNGVRLRPVDHFIEGPLSQQITLTSPPSTGSAVRVNYIKF